MFSAGFKHDCQDCKNPYHISCTRVELDKFKKYNSQTKASWKCEKCKSETLSTTSTCKSDYDTAVLDSLNALKKEMSVQFGIVNSNVVTLIIQGDG